MPSLWWQMLPENIFGRPCPDDRHMRSRFSSKLRYEITSPISVLRRLFKRHIARKAHKYLERNGILDLLVISDQDEIRPVFIDLYYIHKLVRKRKPLFSLEFGSGVSIVVIAHALKLNHLECRDADQPKVWSVDANAHWAANSLAKIPEDLRRYVVLEHSPAAAGEYAGQLCVRHEKLPNIVPDFIYLDGPGSPDIQGSVRGLEFTFEESYVRRPVLADILLYESTLRTGATILLDSRYCDFHFLRHNLRRDYQILWNTTSNQTTFTLDEFVAKKHNKYILDDYKQ